MFGLWSGGLRGGSGENLKGIRRAAEQREREIELNFAS